MSDEKQSPGAGRDSPEATRVDIDAERDRGWNAAMTVAAAICREVAKKHGPHYGGSIAEHCAKRIAEHRLSDSRTNSDQSRATLDASSGDSPAAVRGPEKDGTSSDGSVDSPPVACRLCLRPCRYLIEDRLLGETLPGYCDEHGASMLRPFDEGVLEDSDCDLPGEGRYADPAHVDRGRLIKADPVRPASARVCESCSGTGKVWTPSGPRECTDPHGPRATSATPWAGCEGCGLSLEKEPSIMRRPDARGEPGALLCNDCASKRRVSDETVHPSSRDRDVTVTYLRDCDGCEGACEGHEGMAPRAPRQSEAPNADGWRTNMGRSCLWFAQGPERETRADARADIPRPDYDQALAEAKYQELRNLAFTALGWTVLACGECTMKNVGTPRNFPDWQHEADCAALEARNALYRAIGRKDCVEPGHIVEEAEQKRGGDRG